MFKSKWPVAGAAILIGAAMSALGGQAYADSFSAPLVPCTAVTSPAALTNCAGIQDPLKNGGVTIDDQGDVTIIVNGAATDTTYAASLVSNDGTQNTLIGNLKTGVRGQGALRKDAFFKFGTVGAGNVVLTSGAGPNNEEFVTGVSISSNGLESARDFDPSLVRCTDVTAPGTLSNCGSDPLSRGRIDVENTDGAMSIHISGARPNTTYGAIFRAPNGTSTALGSVGPTNKAGNATKVFSNAFTSGTIGSGEVVLQSGGTDEFVSGFKVNQHFVRPDIAVSNLVACGEVSNPTGLTCGTDPLDGGDYQVETNGAISVNLKGAAPRTNYEVWFRPLDNSGDVDTGIAVPTNMNGNAHVGPKPYFTADSVDSGTLVIKQSGSNQPDEFVAGFKTR
jgi:hypothetical protein